VRVHSMRLENFGPFARLEEIKLGQLATLIGKNDAGKSHTLRALQLFFGRSKLEADDVYDRATAEDEVVMEVALTALPDHLKLEESATTTFLDERLLDASGHLRIRKTFPCHGPLDKPSVALVTYDFADVRFAGLTPLRDKELNERCTEAGIALSENGHRRTAAEKRAALRAVATAQGVPLAEWLLPLKPRDDLWATLEALLPKYEMFETDTRLGVGETSFQSQFRPIVREAADAPAVVAARDAFTDSIGHALQQEVDAIFERLKQHTDAFSQLTVRPQFSWEKAVTFEILGTDEHGVRRSLDQRGTGMRRLLMVSFFQYMAEKSRQEPSNVIYAVEEPENCLHPGLQRELAASFQRLAAEGYQVILTSHSPVFAGASPLADLVLIERTGGDARAIQSPDPEEIAEQLGIEPADHILGASACVFVEGKDDVLFWTTVARKLREGGQIAADFEERRVALMPAGGSNLKHIITLRAVSRLNRRFAVVVDSDRTQPNAPLRQHVEQWRQECEAQGGHFYVLRKREIENYLHRDAILRSGRRPRDYHAHSDMKALFDPRVIEAIEHMTCDELLAMDCYVDEQGCERHELHELAVALLALAGGPSRARRQPASAQLSPHAGRSPQA
jgi:putative ATP-dependent endonuclease of OLD family